MPPETESKKTRQIPFRVSAELAADLEEVAAATPTGLTVQDLLRLAAKALVECHRTNGGIPLDMELRQRSWAPAIDQAAEKGQPAYGAAEVIDPRALGALETKVLEGELARRHVKKPVSRAAPR